MREILRRAWYVVRHRRFEADLDEEMTFHREMKERELIERGASAGDAARAARRAFGSSALAQNRARDVWLWTGLRDAAQDFRFALRLLGRDRSFTFVAVLALALGIGVSNTFLIVVNAVCVRGLPIESVDRVMYLAARDARDRAMGLSYRDLGDMRAGTRAFAGIAAFTSAPAVIGDEGLAPDRVPGAYISANAFSLMREEPVRGRSFAPDDDRPGAAPVVIIGGGLWLSRYAAEPSVIGRTIRVNGVPSTVIGIMRQGYRFPGTADLWQPLAMMPGVADQPRNARGLGAFGRLAHGATRAQAATEAAAVAERLSREYPETNSGIRSTVIPINEQYNAKITDPVWLAFLTAGLLVLLIACSNVANLLLMRATHRSHEIAIRSSLGATRLRVVRQLLIEGLALATLGGIAGLGFSLVGARLLSLSLTDSAPYWLHFTMDGRSFVALAALCLGTVFIFGLAPALHVSKTDTHQVLQDGGRGGTAGRRARHWTTAFLAAEFALTMVLLAATAMGFRSFKAAQQADLVIDPSQLLTMWVSLPAPKYPTPEKRMAFYQQLTDRLRGIPAVASTAIATALPFDGARLRTLIIDGRSPAGSELPPTVATLAAGGDYFKTLGLAVLRGRSFAGTDGMAGHENAIVNQRFVAMYFPNEDPIGRRIRLTDQNAPAPPAWITIVGVSPSVRQQSQGPDPDPVVYLPLRGAAPSNVALMVRHSVTAAAIGALMREELRALDPDLPLYRVMTMEQVISQSRLNGRVSQILVSVIACIALGLSVIGLYAVTAYAVAQRRREIGVRLALGAQARQIITLVLRRAMMQLGVGVVAGVICTAAWEKWFGDPADAYRMTDPLLLATVTVVIGAVALVACLLPASRATRLDPIVALRHE